jgi:rhamnulose-1-phosphate aldolase
VAYGTAKAAQLHQARLLAVELAEIGVRVNAVNPDAVVRGSGIFAGGWGTERAKAYGVEEKDLGKYYAERTLLKQEILPEDVAAAVFVLVGPELRKSTGLVINVDGGFPPSMMR